MESPLSLLRMPWDHEPTTSPSPPEERRRRGPGRGGRLCLSFSPPPPPRPALPPRGEREETDPVTFNPRFMESGHLQNSDVDRGHEPARGRSPSAARGH